MLHPHAEVFMVFFVLWGYPQAMRLQRFHLQLFHLLLQLLRPLRRQGPEVFCFQTPRRQRFQLLIGVS